MIPYVVNEVVEYYE